jgi:hypothetical protein
VNARYGLGAPFASDVAFGPHVLHDVRSVSKSVVGLLIGIAQQKALVPSVGVSVLRLFPELADLRTPERDRAPDPARDSGDARIRLPVVDREHPLEGPRDRGNGSGVNAGGSVEFG